MEAVKVVRVLNRDSLGRVELVEREGELYVRRVACGGRLPLSRLVARLLLARERRALDALRGLAGVPRLEHRADLAASALEPGAPRGAVLVRSFVDGEPLHRAEALPEDFFERLAELVGDLHRRGVCHNDLHKEQNVLVGEDGRPSLVDFQLASVHARSDAAFAARAREDLRHVEKHRRRYTRDGRGPRGERLFGRGAGQPRSLLARVWRRAGKPIYNALVHALLRRPASEERRPITGPWPVWTAAIAPRASGGHPANAAVHRALRDPQR